MIKLLWIGVESVGVWILKILMLISPLVFLKVLVLLDGVSIKIVPLVLILWIFLLLGQHLASSGHLGLEGQFLSNSFFFLSLELLLHELGLLRLVHESVLWLHVGVASETSLFLEGESLGLVTVCWRIVELLSKTILLDGSLESSVSILVLQPVHPVGEEVFVSSGEALNLRGLEE